jgi:hypothetical protein
MWAWAGLLRPTDPAILCSLVAPARSPLNLAPHPRPAPQSANYLARAWACVILFSFANVLKCIAAKVISRSFYCNAHYKKAQSALENEYFLLALAQPREELMEERAARSKSHISGARARTRNSMAASPPARMSGAWDLGRGSPRARGFRQPFVRTRGGFRAAARRALQPVERVRAPARPFPAPPRRRL